METVTWWWLYKLYMGFLWKKPTDQGAEKESAQTEGASLLRKIEVFWGVVGGLVGWWKNLQDRLTSTLGLVGLKLLGLVGKQPSCGTLKTHDDNVYTHQNETLKRWGFSVCIIIFSPKNGMEKLFSGLRLLKIHGFLQKNLHPGLWERNIFWITVHFCMQEIGTQMAKNADKPSMFLGGKFDWCFQHALDSINVCGKARPCLWHVWFFYTKLWFEDASKFEHCQNSVVGLIIFQIQHKAMVFNMFLDLIVLVIFFAERIYD